MRPAGYTEGFATASTALALLPLQLDWDQERAHNSDGCAVPAVAVKPCNMLTGPHEPGFSMLSNSIL